MDSGYEWLDGLYRVKVKKGATLTRSDKHPGLFSSNTRLNGFPGGPCELSPILQEDLYHYLSEEDQIKLFTTDEPLTSDQQYKLARDRQRMEIIAKNMSDGAANVCNHVIDKHIAPFIGKVGNKTVNGIKKLFKKEEIDKEESSDQTQSVSTVLVNFSEFGNNSPVIDHSISQEEAAKEFYLALLYYQQMMYHLNNLYSASVEFTESHSLDGSDYCCWAIEHQEEVIRALPQSFQGEAELFIQQIEKRNNEKSSLTLLCSTHETHEK